MKNTKKFLSAGVALAIALFASVQVIAMENKPVNPYLSEQDKRYMKNQIEFNTPGTDPTRKGFMAEPYYQAQLKATIDAYKEMYYGNKPYTRDEIREMLDKHQDNARTKFGYQ
jgi:hypothetical protein